jgi:hypothetical protein
MPKNTNNTTPNPNTETLERHEQSIAEAIHDTPQEEETLSRLHQLKLAQPKEGEIFNHLHEPKRVQPKKGEPSSPTWDKLLPPFKTEEDEHAWQEEIIAEGELSSPNTLAPDENEGHDNTTVALPQAEAKHAHNQDKDVDQLQKTPSIENAKTEDVDADIKKAPEYTEPKPLPIEALMEIYHATEYGPERQKMHNIILGIEPELLKMKSIISKSAPEKKEVSMTELITATRNSEKLIILEKRNETSPTTAKRNQAEVPGKISAHINYNETENLLGPFGTKSLVLYVDKNTGVCLLQGSSNADLFAWLRRTSTIQPISEEARNRMNQLQPITCLLYTSDAADDM